jgi:hypothetical protein
MAFQQYREVGTAYSGAWTEFSLNIVFEDDPSSVAPSPVVMLAEGVLDHTCCEGLTGCTLPTHNKLKSRLESSRFAQASDCRQELCTSLDINALILGGRKRIQTCDDPIDPKRLHFFQCFQQPVLDHYIEAMIRSGTSFRSTFIAASYLC